MPCTRPAVKQMDSMKKYRVTVDDKVIDEGLSYREACELATEIDNDPRYYRNTVDIEPMEESMIE